jgi:hypothetical protein
MSTDRLPKERGWADSSKLQKGPNGRPCCRQCGQEVPKGSRTFCSHQCVHDWKCRTDPGYQRDQVELRDRGVCTLCSIDTDAIRRWRAEAFRYTSIHTWPPEHRKVTRYENGAWTERQATDADVSFDPPALHSERWGWWGGPDGHGFLKVTVDLTDETKQQIIAFLRASDPYVKNAGHRTSYWDMDHILPVIEGGGACGLENLRTLCLVCHRQVTRELAARRAEQRRLNPQPKKAREGRSWGQINNPVRALVLQVLDHVKQGHDRKALNRILRVTNRWMHEEDRERCHGLLMYVYPPTWGVTATLGVLAALDPVREQTREARDLLIDKLRRHLIETRPSEVDDLMRGIR